MSQNNIKDISKIIENTISDLIDNPILELEKLSKLNIRLSIDDCIELFNSSVKLNKLFNILIEKKLLIQYNINDNELIKKLIKASSILNSEENLDDSYVQKIYIRDYLSYLLLSKEEELELAIKAKTGDKKAREKLINHNLRLVVSIALKYTKRGMSIEDLVQEGIIGLMIAVDKFNPNVGTKLSTFATYWIKQTINRAIENNGKTIRIPSYLHDKIRSLKKAENHLRGVLGREPNYKELAKYLDITEEKVIEIILLSKESVSLNMPLYDEEESEFGDILASPYDLEDDVDTKTMSLFLQNMLSSGELDELEYQIIVMRYGFNGFKPQTLESIGEKFNVSGEWIRQKEKATLEKISKLIGADKEVILSNNRTNLNEDNSLASYTEHNIYQEFSNYSIDEINQAIDLLSPDEKDLLKLRFGDKFDLKCFNYSWTLEDEKAYITYVYPKIKSLLEEITACNFQKHI